MTDTLPSTPSEKDAQTSIDSTLDPITQQLLIEISKALLSGNLAVTRGAMQILQGLTGVLLASYTTLLVGFGKQVGIDRIPPVASALPIVFYLLSLIIGFGQIILYRGTSLTVGDLLNGLEAYETVLSTQRKQLILPMIFSFAGLVAVIVVILNLLSLT